MNENNRVNHHIEEYLDYYCRLSHSPGFAVLLKGQWGAGKTWFINRYTDKFQETEHQDYKQRYLYVSLYGMTATSEIEDAFFQLLNPLWSSKEMRTVWRIFKGMIKGHLKIDLPGGAKDEATLNVELPDVDLLKHLQRINKSILIFDDVERSKIDLDSLLGYINYFVEHQGLKVIIIANEDELFKFSNYQFVKEKLIGKTFSISLDFDGVLENFIAKTEDSSAGRFLSNNTLLIKDLYNKAEYRNLRTLRQIILDFERIFKILPHRAKSKIDLLQDLLKLLIIFSIEIKQGVIRPEIISRLDEEYAIQSSKKKTSLQTVLIDKYNLLDLYEPFPSKVWWQIFFNEGSINNEELEQSLQNSRYFQDENTPNWTKLWYFRHLEDDEFDVVLKEVESEYFNRNFRDPQIVKHITGTFLALSEAELCRRNKAEILSDAKLYLDQLRANNQLEPLQRYVSLAEVIGYISGSYKGLEFHGKEFREFKEFSSYLNEIQELVRVETMPIAGQNLVTIMQNDISKFYGMICSEGSGNQDTEERYYEIPIFKYVEPTDFIEKLLLIKPLDQQFILSLIEKRYRHEQIGEKLIEELEWLKSVRELLQEEVILRRNKVSGYNLKLSIEQFLDKAIEKLEEKGASMNKINQ